MDFGLIFCVALSSDVVQVYAAIFLAFITAFRCFVMGIFVVVNMLM